MKKNIPQLPAPRKKIAQDAARAVRRTRELALQQVSAETLSELLALPGMRVTHFALETDVQPPQLHLFCEHVHQVGICPRCQQPSEALHDCKERCVRHLDTWGWHTLVHFTQRRFECAHCAQHFTENLAWLEPKRRHTQAFELHIYQRIQQKTPRRQVAQSEGLHEATVQEIFKRQAQRALKHAQAPRVRVLGVDEIALLKQHKQYALVLSDLQRRCVLDVLPDRRQETLAVWLQHLSPAERKAIKVVSMDMWHAYRRAVQQHLPHAQIVADRFHVMKQLNHQLDLLRRSLQRHAKKQEDETLYQALKGSRWVLLKPRATLNAAQQTQLQTLLATSDELRTIYLLKEEFRTICNKIKHRPQAARFLQAWTWKAWGTQSRYLQRFVQTLRNWWHEFLNYFNDRVTQGFVEGINRAIRGIIQRAFGFHNFDNFRLQVLVECGDG